MKEITTDNPKPSVDRVSLTLDEAAASIGISYVSLWRLTKAGKIRTVRALSKQLVPVSELNRFIQDQLVVVNAVPIVRHRADEKCGSWLILGFISKLGQWLSPRTPTGPVGTGA